MESTKINIIPASLALTEEESKLQLEKITPLSKKIHIDYADGEFVDNSTVDWQILFDLPTFYPHHRFELHLMAKDPLLLAQEAVKKGFTRVILPVEELNSGEVSVVAKLVQDCELFISLNPETSVEEAALFLSLVEGVSIMTVKPGAQGQPFNEIMLDKIDQLKRLNFKGQIEVDGSVNLETIDRILEHNVTDLVVGSAILDSDSPKGVFEQLEQKVRENEQSV